jgi:hypothetical protein
MHKCALKKKNVHFALRALKTSNNNNLKNKNQFAQAKEHGVLGKRKKKNRSCFGTQAAVFSDVVCVFRSNSLEGKQIWADRGNNSATVSYEYLVI